MIWALLGLALFVSSGEPLVLLSEDEDGRLEFDPTRVARDGDLVSLTLHMTPSFDRGYAVAQADVRVACDAQTVTLAAFRTYDGAGALVRSADVPTDRLTPNPIYQEGPYGELYRRVCPGGVLSPAPPPPPPPVPVPPGR